MVAQFADICAHRFQSTMGILLCLCASGQTQRLRKTTQLNLCATRLPCGVSWYYRNRMHVTVLFTRAMCAISAQVE